MTFNFLRPGIDLILVHDSHLSRRDGDTRPFPETFRSSFKLFEYLAPDYQTPAPFFNPVKEPLPRRSRISTEYLMGDIRINNGAHSLQIPRACYRFHRDRRVSSMKNLR